MKKMTLFLSALAAITTATVAVAQDGSGVLRRTDFFDDASLTNQVGEFVEYCDGTSSFNGEITGHSRVQQYDC